MLRISAAIRLSRLPEWGSLSTKSFLYHPDSSNKHILVRRSADSRCSTKHCLPYVLSPRCTCEEDLDDPAYDEAIIVGSWNGYTVLLLESARENLCLDLYVRDIVWHRQDDSDGREKGREDNVLLADLRVDTVHSSSYFWMPLERVCELSWMAVNSNVEISKLVVSTMGPPACHKILVKRPSGRTDAPVQQSIDMDAQPVTQPWRKRGWITEIENWLV